MTGMNAASLRTLPVLALLAPFDCAVAASLLLSALLCRPLARKQPPVFPAADVTRVTIQILNWDGKHLLQEFLPGVVQAAGNHRVVVVDNGSRDGSVEFVKETFPAVDVVHLDHNYGFAIGNNLGIDRTDTDVVVLLNNDMAVEPGFLDPLLAPLSDPSVFAVAARVMVPDPAKAHHETGKTCGRFERGMFYLWHAPVEPGGGNQPVFWAGGGACALDRRKFRELGGFDRLYHPFYVEDADLSYQAWKRGWKSLLAPESLAVHRHRGTSGPRFGHVFVDNTTRRNLFLLVWKNLTDLKMLLEHCLQLPRIHSRGIRERGAAFEIRAYLRALLRLPLALARRFQNARVVTAGDADTLRMSQ
jgi:GT2 family glycosyltransferase